MGLNKFTKEMDESSSDSENNIQEADDQYDIEKFNPGAESQSNNKSIYRKNFGVEIQFPTKYVIDAKLYPLDLNFFIQIVKFVKPEKQYKVKSYTFKKGAPKSPEMAPSFGKQFDSNKEMKEKLKYAKYNVVF